MANIARTSLPEAHLSTFRATLMIKENRGRRVIEEEQILLRVGIYDINFIQFEEEGK
jgi:hypothetical protein